ncbi:MAG: BrnT family toxin [Deltaproteobacteria bacterium]|nr:BrnT family toxin [Deltaproteobacteria bacterium]
MLFEWDENKNRINRKTHHISFEYAARVWNDEKRLVDFDDEHSTGTELRWHAIGLVDKVIVVVYIEKSADLVRLISARKATREECNEYYRNYESR